MVRALNSYPQIYNKAGLFNEPAATNRSVRHPIKSHRFRWPLKVDSFVPNQQTQMFGNQTNRIAHANRGPVLLVLVGRVLDPKVLAYRAGANPLRC